jgi:hypothetical protein
MSITRNPSLNSFPVNKTNNQLNFLVPMDERPIDMLSSYVELEVDIPTLANKRNVCLGQDGFQYEPSCFFRSVKLEDAGRGVVCQTNYINVLNENLKYISCSENDKLSESIYNGGAHNNPNAPFGSAHELVSVFNNAYPDSPYPVIRCPISSLIKGELGEAMYQQKGDLNLRTNLEPSYPLFQRAVEAFVYTGTVETQGTEYAIQNTVASAPALLTGATAMPSDLINNEYALITGLIGSDLLSSVRKITNIGASGINFAITLDQVIEASSEPLTEVEIVHIRDNHEIRCNDLSASGATLTISSATPYSATKDIYSLSTEKTRVKVNYMVYSELSQSVIMESVLRTVASLTLSGDNIATIVLDEQLVLPASGQKLIFISVEPLFTNLVRDYQIQNAHLVLYRRNQKVKEGKQMVVSQFSSNAVACVASLDRFVHSVPALSNNCFNAYVLTPSATNMISQRQNFTQYLLSIDELQLTQVYLPLSGSALHKENVLRTFSNSPTEKPMNLKTNRDRYIAKSGEITQDLVVGKIYSSMLGGEMNIQPVGNSRTLKIDMEATSTLATNVLIFTEQYMML